jgi:bifunctional DNA-binding transcriptional regulator/antitoxin component of YhaV-PrlF toxin-antitoxin module
VVVVEEFVARVFAGGKVTVPGRLRELFGVENGRLERIMKEYEVYVKETER